MASMGVVCNRSIGRKLLLGSISFALLVGAQRPAAAGGPAHLAKFKDRRAVKGEIGRTMRRVSSAGSLAAVPGAYGKPIPNQPGTLGGGGGGGGAGGSFSNGSPTAVEFNTRRGDLHVYQLPTVAGRQKLYLALGKMANGGKGRPGARYVAVVTPDASRKGYQVLGSVNHGLDIVGAGSLAEARAATRNYVYSRNQRLGQGDRAQLDTQLGQLKRAIRQHSVVGQEQAARDIASTLLGPQTFQGLSGKGRPWHGSPAQWIE